MAKELGVDVRQAASLRKSTDPGPGAQNRKNAIVLKWLRRLLGDHLAAAARQSRAAFDADEFPDPIDLVLVGDIQQMSWLADIVRAEMREHSFPVNFASVRVANDPHLSVVKGCLIGALTHEE